jgi:hypothetical protein
MSTAQINQNDIAAIFSFEISSDESEEAVKKPRKKAVKIKKELAVPLRLAQKKPKTIKKATTTVGKSVPPPTTKPRAKPLAKSTTKPRAKPLAKSTTKRDHKPNTLGEDTLQETGTKNNLEKTDDVVIKRVGRPRKRPITNNDKKEPEGIDSFSPVKKRMKVIAVQSPELGMSQISAHVRTELGQMKVIGDEFVWNSENEDRNASLPPSQQLDLKTTPFTNRSETVDENLSRKAQIISWGNGGRQNQGQLIPNPRPHQKILLKNKTIDRIEVLNNNKGKSREKIDISTTNEQRNNARLRKPDHARPPVPKVDPKAQRFYVAHGVLRGKGEKPPSPENLPPQPLGFKTKPSKNRQAPIDETKSRKAQATYSSDSGWDDQAQLMQESVGLQTAEFMENEENMALESLDGSLGHGQHGNDLGGNFVQQESDSDENSMRAGVKISAEDFKVIDDEDSVVSPVHGTKFNSGRSIQGTRIRLKKVAISIAPCNIIGLTCNL